MGPCVPVVGPPRTGTSALVGVLRALGVRAGDRLDPPLDGAASEDADFGELFRDLFDGTPHPLAHPMAPTRPARLADLAALCAARCAGAGPWGVKHYLLPFAWPYFLAALPAGCGVRPVFTRRCEAEAARSWADARGLPRALAHARLREWRAACDAARLSFPGEVLVVDFADLMDRPAESVARLAGWCGLPAAAGALAAVDPSLSKHRGAA